MKKMTERERLIELLAPTSLDFEEAVELADHLIANGVRIPVRCEECVHRQKVITINNRSYVSCRHCGEIKEIGDFCKHGEKREYEEEKRI